MTAGAGSASDAQVPAVELVGVGRVFHRPRESVFGPRPEVTALADVSLTVPRRARFGIVGESGSGKTTLIRLMAGLDQPTTGSVVVDGVQVSGRREREIAPLRRRLQLVFQDPMGSLDPRMRIGAIIAESLRGMDPASRQTRVAEVLGQVGLPTDILRRYPHQFSGGQRQRISIARAIAGRPAILLADEAVSALDVTVRAQILDLLDELATAEDFTLVFVSHDLSVIRRVCDQVAVLHEGRVVETGSTEQVYSDPQVDYTRSLLAAVPTLERGLAAARARRAAGG
ncbi:ABC transporter ATP-binding protein [Nakamurella silvestris]|nr:ABC transporter ATP-binding protein [Nakamurella silvestris]